MPSPHSVPHMQAGHLSFHAVVYIDRLRGPRALREAFYKHAANEIPAGSSE